jgi:hypothetical protein
MKVYLIISATLFAITTLVGITQSKDAGDSVVCVLSAAISAWGFYLAFNL